MENEKVDTKRAKEWREENGYIALHLRMGEPPVFEEKEVDRLLAAYVESECSRLASRVEELEKKLEAHKDLFWPPANEEEEHIYEIRNGKTADYVRVHVEALAGAHAEEKPND